jgi:hypothetical protein
MDGWMNGLGMAGKEGFLSFSFSFLFRLCFTKRAIYLNKKNKENFQIHFLKEIISYILAAYWKVLLY